MKYEWANLHVRPALPQDKNRVIELVSAILQEYRFACDFANSENDLLDIERTYLSSKGAFNVFLDAEGNIIGTYGILPLADGACKLRKMYLIPKARGIGLGTHIMQHAIKTAQQLGFNRIVLETTTIMKAAIHLYRKSGFQEINQLPQSPRCDHVFFLDLQ